MMGYLPSQKVLTVMISASVAVRQETDGPRLNSFSPVDRNSAARWRRLGPAQIRDKRPCSGRIVKENSPTTQGQRGSLEVNREGMPPQSK